MTCRPRLWRRDGGRGKIPLSRMPSSSMASASASASAALTPATPFQSSTHSITCLSSSSDTQTDSLMHASEGRFHYSRIATLFSSLHLHTHRHSPVIGCGIYSSLRALPVPGSPACATSRLRGRSRKGFCLGKSQITNRKSQIANHESGRHL